MTRDDFHLLALKACVNKMENDARKKNAWSPLLLTLKPYVDGGQMPNEQQVALVRYLAEHSEA